jgi:hypothetical protein
MAPDWMLTLAQLQHEADGLAQNIQVRCQHGVKSEASFGPYAAHRHGLKSAQACHDYHLPSPLPMGAQLPQTASDGLNPEHGSLGCPGTAECWTILPPTADREASRSWPKVARAVSAAGGTTAGSCRSAGMR